MYLFKKIVAKVFFPVPLCLELLWVGLVLKWVFPARREGKWLIVTGIVLLTLLSFRPFSNLLLQPLEYRYQPLVINSLTEGKRLAHSNNIKWVVVLSGGATSSPDLPIVSQLTQDTVLRLVEGIRLYRQMPSVRLLLSGGQIEIPLMMQLALELGVDPNYLVTESTSRDTKDQACNIKQIVKTDSFVLVTEASHMPRSMALLTKQDLSPIPAPTGHRVKLFAQFKWSRVFPNSESLQMAERAFYEYLGLAWATVRGQV